MLIAELLLAITQMQLAVGIVLCAALFAGLLGPYLWEEIRNHFRAMLFGSMTELLTAVAVGIERQRPVLRNSS